MNENLLSVGTVVASDSDGGDSVTGYSVSGGADRARFSITNGGVLTFRSVPDFEVPVDVGGNNVYNIVLLLRVVVVSCAYCYADDYDYCY